MRTALLLLLAVAPATAMQTQVPLPELCFSSTRVVVAEVTSTETVWSTAPDGGLETHVWFASTKNIRGTGPETVELTLPGGEKDGLTHWVEHTPHFELDARYMLFLAPHAERGLEILGGEQGAIRIAARPGDKGASLAEVLRGLGDCHVP